MTATIGGLLDQLHHLASQPPAPADSTDDVDSWPWFARYLSAALTQLPFAPNSAGDRARAQTQTVLDHIARQPHPTSPVDQTGRIAALTRVTGAIADVLATQQPPPRLTDDTHAPEDSATQAAPAAPVVDDPTAAGLQSSLLAAVWAATQTTLSHTQPTDLRGLDEPLRNLAALTQPHALIPPELRRSALEHLSATPRQEPSLQGAITRWAAHAEDALERHQISSATLAMLANDLALLTNALHHVAPTAHVTFEDDLQHESLVEATALWQQIAAWPTDSLTLAGTRPDELIDSSRELRHYLDALLRHEDEWLTREDLVRTHGQQSLDSLAHTLANSTRQAARRYADTLTEAAVHPGRLWRTIASAVELDPTTPRTRTTGGPGKREAAELPSHWVITRRVREDVHNLVTASKQAAGLHARVAGELNDLLTQPSTFETVPAVRLNLNRIHATPGQGPAPVDPRRQTSAAPGTHHDLRIDR